MQKLDENKPYGRVTPPYHAANFDRPAHYEQDGCMFDGSGLEIIPGKPLERTVAVEVKAEDQVPSGDLTPLELLEQVDSLKWPKFRAQAKRILGEVCPPNKEGMVSALKDAVEKFTARTAKRVATAAPQPANGKLDLAAWGRGQTEYLFGEVRKAIRDKYHVSVTETRDAVDILIENGVVSLENARKTD